MNADFDGDEMELFLFASKADDLEGLALMSPYAQFIDYQSGYSIIGGKGAEENVYPGSFHLKTQKFKYGDFEIILRDLPTWKESLRDKECSGTDIV